MQCAACSHAQLTVPQLQHSTTAPTVNAHHFCHDRDATHSVLCHAPARMMPRGSCHAPCIMPRPCQVSCLPWLEQRKTFLNILVCSDAGSMVATEATHFAAYCRVRGIICGASWHVRGITGVASSPGAPWWHQAQALLLD